MKTTLTALTLAVALTGCVDGRDAAIDPTPGARTDRAQASMRDASGATRAAAVLTQQASGVRIGINASGMMPGIYGAHVHAVGRCDAPDFTTAGAHWNPSGQQHGRDNPQGAHAGDLPNFAVGSDGSGSMSFTIPGARLTGGANPLMDADRAAVIVHAAPDDYRTDPSGNSGARVACGVVGVAR